MRNMTITHLRCWLFGAAFLGCIFAAGRMLPRLNQMRERHSLLGHTGVADVPIADTLLTQATGPFRAFAIMTLWMRATKHQEEGRYFEQNDLFHLISRLQPRFESVWAHWAWNMAYNISVKFPARPGHDRWRWVESGISILRDRGIPNNRKSVLLRRELAWIYHHKIGQDADDAHRYYKVALAVTMERAFGRPPYYDRLQAMSKTPKARHELLKDEAVRDLIAALVEAGTDPFDASLDLVNRTGELPEPVLALLEKEAGSDRLTRLELYLRARYIEDVLKLEFDRLLYYMELFGTKQKPASIEWRLPSAHALYWAGESVRVAEKDIKEAINSDRIFLYGLQDQYRNGSLRFYIDPKSKEVFMEPSPNFDFIDPCLALHKAISERYGGDVGSGVRPTHDNVLNFLREVVMALYIHSGEDAAKKYYRMLTDLGPESKTLPLGEFVELRLAENMKSLGRAHAMQIIQGMLYQSLVSKSFGHEERSARQLAYAKWIKERHDEGRRSVLPPMVEMLKNAIALTRATMPDYVFAAIEEEHPELIQQLKDEAAKKKTPGERDFKQPKTPNETDAEKKARKAANAPKGGLSD